MEFIKTNLLGVYIIENAVYKDNRGVFVKTFHNELFREKGLCDSFKESYYSVSHKNVIRGMHFQLPPYDHEKIVYVPQGAVKDVVLDLRKGSPSFQKFIAVELNEDNRNAIYIPKGLGHGFCSLANNTITTYNVSKVYDSNCDSGIRWDSFGFD